MWKEGSRVEFCCEEKGEYEPQHSIRMRVRVICRFVVASSHGKLQIQSRGVSMMLILPVAWEHLVAT